MPAFYIPQPECVFIHNPKTGGHTLRKVLLAGEYEGPVTGRLPEAWLGHFKFAFVRNPFDRLISAWKMFTEGVEASDWTMPRDARPGLPLADFLGIVTDESIGHGPGRRFDRRVRNHTLPQTHPYYAIDQADFVGRFEHFQRDVDMVWRRLGLPPAELPVRHRSRRGPYRDYFDAATRRLATQYYGEDLRVFGYGFDEA